MRLSWFPVSVKSHVGLGYPVVMLTLAFTAVGCGDSDGGQSPLPEPDLDSSKPLIELTPTETAQLCDWGVSQFGGYGAQPRCSDGDAITVAQSQEQCVSDSPSSNTCTATVSDQMDCVYALAADPCQITFFSTDACRAVLDCVL